MNMCFPDVSLCPQESEGAPAKVPAQQGAAGAAAGHRDALWGAQGGQRWQLEHRREHPDQHLVEFLLQFRQPAALNERLFGTFGRFVILQRWRGTLERRLAARGYSSSMAWFDLEIGCQQPSRPVSDDEIQRIAAEPGAEEPLVELSRLHFNVRRQLLFKKRPSECQEA